MKLRACSSADRASGFEPAGRGFESLHARHCFQRVNSLDGSLQVGCDQIVISVLGFPSFRATGITAYLENGCTIENAQAIAAHESPRTTKLYHRTSDEITLDAVERIAI